MPVVRKVQGSNPVSGGKINQVRISLYFPLLGYEKTKYEYEMQTINLLTNNESTSLVNGIGSKLQDLSTRNCAR